MDAVSEAARFGISASRAARYEHDVAGTQLNFSVLSKAVGLARRADSAEMMNAMFDCEELLEDIRSDHKKRHKS